MNDSVSLISSKDRYLRPVQNERIITPCVLVVIDVQVSSGVYSLMDYNVIKRRNTVVFRGEKEIDKTMRKHDIV